MECKNGFLQLFEQSKEFYDDKNNGLSQYAQEASRELFTGGARWMMQALQCLRNKRVDLPNVNYEILGLFKYGSALLTGIFISLTFWKFSPFISVIAFILAFYAVEAQFVFLFPLAIDRTPKLIRSSLWMTPKAGGTTKVMGIVLPIAAYMLLGGFSGKGFLRSWCIGCLAIVIWYETIRDEL